MKWTRVENGVYAAGPYTVRRSALSAKFWNVQGPGVHRSMHDTKADAQEHAVEAAKLRYVEDADPEVGDLVVSTDGKGVRGQISSVLTIDPDNPTYVLKTSRGRRHCFRRDEIILVTP